MKSVTKLSTAALLAALLGVALATPAMATITEDASFTTGFRNFGGVAASGGSVVFGLDFTDGMRLTNYNGGGAMNLSSLTADDIDFDGTSIAITQGPVLQDPGSIFEVWDAATGTLNYTINIGAFPQPYGNSIAINGNYTVVGTHGGTYVYDNTTQSQIHSLGISGRSIAMDGTHLVVGDSEDDTMGFNRGKVTIYEMSNLAGGPIGTHYGTNNGDGMGKDVDVSNGVVVAGAWFGDTAGVTNSGSAVVLDVNGNVTSNLEITNLTEQDRFGFSVAIDNDMIVVGAPNSLQTAGPVSAKGAAYLFDVSGDLIDEFNVAGGTSVEQHFGTHVDFEGDTVFVSDEFSDVTNTMYRYDLSIDPTDVPDVLDLALSVAPNPFNPATTIRFTLPAAASGRLDVFGVDGRRVATLADGAFAAGSHELRWDGRDHRGAPAASGTYLARLAAGELRRTVKMVLVE